MSVQRRPASGPATKGRRVQWIVRYRDPDGKDRSSSFGTKREADLRDAEIKRELARGGWIDPRDQDITVKELAEQWRDQAVRDGTKKDRQFLIDNLGALTNCPVGKVRPTMLTEWVTLLRQGRPWAEGRPLAESNIANRCSQLRALFQRAVDDGILARNPGVALKRLKRPEGTVTERAVPTAAMIRALSQAAMTGGVIPPTEDGQKGPVSVPESVWMAWAIRIAAETGLRAGEVAGLQGRDVDIKQKLIRVRHQRVRVSAELSPLKTRQSIRTVPISPTLAKSLKSLVREDDQPVVMSAWDRPISSQRISALMPRLRRFAEVPEEISFHGLRHYYASKLLGEGVPLTTVSALLGHGNVAITADVYAHFLPGQMDVARGALKALAWDRYGS